MIEKIETCPFLKLEVELKACPFCGYHTARLYYNANAKQYFVYCELCHCMAAPDRFKDFAISNWNKRNKEQKRMPIYDKHRPCVFELGEYCGYVNLPVYTKYMCEECKRRKNE